LKLKRSRKLRRRKLNKLYWINKNNVTGDAPGYNSNDSLFKYFEQGVQNWSQNQGYTLINFNQNTSSTSSTGFTIISPKNGSLIPMNERATITISGFSPQTTQVEYYINNTLIGKSTESPYSFSFIPSSIGGIVPENEIKAVATERLGKFTEVKTIFTTQ